MIESSVPAVLRERASLQPNDTAFTYLDYEKDPAGVAQTLTWAQLYRQSLNVAEELKRCGSPEDRAVILAPQGLEYIAAFLGALQAGFYAVPLPVPAAGAHDERVSSVLEDTSPSVILTTSAEISTVADYAQPRNGGRAPAIIEVDKLDLDAPCRAGRSEKRPNIAYLQYTSGSTRTPAGVVITHRNLTANFEQLMCDFFDKAAPPDTTIVSWLPFYHDMGLVLGICAPILAGFKTVLTSPMAFLQKPARWIQLLATNSRSVTAAPNFAFELAVRRTTDEDMAGLDMGDVMHILSGSERVHAATLKRFTDRFARFNFPEAALRPAYGLAEATVYAATRTPLEPPVIAHFDAEKLSAGHAQRCESQDGTPLISYGVPQSPVVRIVDPDTGIECPAGKTGEIWVHGENVAEGYWGKQEESERIFAAQLTDASDGTPEGPWLRTGDLGFVSEGELFIMGRIKDLLIVYGRNHSPDDIEATIQEITGGRCVAIAVPDKQTEKLVAIIEVKKRGDTPEDVLNKLHSVKGEVTSAISRSHGLKVADLVAVSPGSIPITTSGKVRRAACVDQYRRNQFSRLDA
jgi:fatty acid CoA ligase FadD28